MQTIRKRQMCYNQLKHDHLKNNQLGLRGKVPPNRGGLGNKAPKKPKDKEDYTSTSGANW